MTFAGSMEKSINGYKNLGDTTDRNWGKFIPDTGSFDNQSNDYQVYKQAQQKAIAEAHKQSLPIEERDKNIRAIVKHLGLSASDRQKLRERGLNDSEIDKGCFASVKPFSELPETINTRLAGIYIGKNGKPHIGSDFQQGILCPIWNQDNLIIGYQVRRESKTNKYVWASTSEKKMEKGDRPKISSHLPNGELPITVFRNSEQKQSYLCDGILKSKIANLKHNINIAGASGGNFLASKNQFLEILDQGYDIYILDGGDILNQQVIKRLKSLAIWVKNNSDKELKFAWYGQIEKDNNDIDEIAKFEYDLLTIDELLELANNCQFIKKKLEQLDKLKRFTPDITFNSKYCLDELIKINPIGKILASKAPMGTGKTYYLKELTNSLNEKFILINNRRVLCSKLAVKLALEYISQGKNITDVKEALSRATDAELEAINGLAIVIDSLLKLLESDYENSFILIDEANQLVESLFLSNTHIKSIRGRVIRLLSDIISKAKGVILADANLSDHTVNFFASLNKKLEVVKVENEYKENNLNCFIYSSQESIKSEIESSIADNEKIMIISDSAKELTAINDLIKRKGINSVLLTQDNLADYPELHRFLDDNGVAIKDENLSVLLLSPVGQSGISLEIGDYFDKVYGLIFGVVSTDTARQLLRRDRSLADRHIWIADRGIGYTTNYDPQEILKNQDFINEQVAIGSQLFSREGQSIDENILNWAKAIIEGKDELRKLAELTAAELITKNNIEKSDYKSILIQELINDGYQVTELDDNELPYDDLFFEQIKGQKTANQWSEAKGITEAPKISEAQAKILENQDSLKQTERYKLKKFKIQQSLPEMKLDEQFIFYGVLKDRFKLINGVNNYYLAQHPEIASILDNNQLIYQFNQVEQNGIYWQFDLKARKLLADLFAELEIQKLIDSDEILDTRKIDSLVKRFNWHRQKLRVFNIKFNNKTYSTKLLKKVLELYGHTLKCVKNDRTGNQLYKVVRMTYKVDKYTVIDKWQDIYSAIERKNLGLIKKDLTIENEEKIDSEQKSAKPIYIKELEMTKEPPNSIKSDLSSLVTSNEDISRDRDLFLEKVPKSELKMQINPIEQNTKFLNRVIKNLGKDYILAMSSHEFGMWAEKWLENGMTQFELNQLVAIREKS